MVHADIVGYSRLIGQNDIGTLERLRTLRRDLIDPAIAEHGGRIVNTAGDSLLMVFESADGAVRFAVATAPLRMGQSDSASGSTWATSFRMAWMCTAMW